MNVKETIVRPLARREGIRLPHIDADVQTFDIVAPQ
jgi:hypothetical protein